VLADELPKGPTGKPMRIGLAEKLKLPILSHGAASDRGASEPFSLLSLLLPNCP
jgi:hypothetical protein